MGCIVTDFGVLSFVGVVDGGELAVGTFDFVVCGVGSDIENSVELLVVGLLGWIV